MRARLVRGGLALILRQGLSIPLNALGLACASRFLSPKDFGVYAVITILINTAAIFIDLGTTTALVQQREEPSPELCRRVVFLKHASAAAIVALLTILANPIIKFYGLPDWMRILCPLCGVVAWLQSLRGFQSIWLQRRLEWQHLARIEIAEVIIYNVVLSIAAYISTSPIAWLIGLGIRSFIGLTLIGSNHRRTLTVARQQSREFSRLLSYGGPYQACTGLSMIQKCVNPLVLGNIAGVGVVGLVNWSIFVANLPLLPLQPLYTFLFSAVAERQRLNVNDTEVIGILTRTGIAAVTVISFFLIVSLPQLLKLLGHQWNEALPTASILLIGNTITLGNSLATTYLTAVGHSNTWMKLVIIETLLLVISCTSGGYLLGAVGYAIAAVLSSTTMWILHCIVLERVAGLKLQVRYGMRYTGYLCAAVAIASAIGSNAMVGHLAGLYAAIAGTATLALLLLVFERKSLRADARILRERLRIVVGHGNT